MKNAPEFLAIGVWCLFISALAIAQEKSPAARPAFAQNAASSLGTNPASPGVLTTGRSSAHTAPNPYGDLFIDPSLGEDAAVYKGPKPTSADLTAK
jgi:hypothetical protein